MCLLLTKKEVLVKDLEVEGNFNCRVHEVMEFKILRANEQNKIMVLHFRRAEVYYLGCFWQDLKGDNPGQFTKGPRTVGK